MRHYGLVAACIWFWSFRQMEKPNKFLDITSNIYIEHFNRWLRRSAAQCLFMLARDQINFTILCAIYWKLIKSNFRQKLISARLWPRCFWYDFLILASKQKSMARISGIMLIIYRKSSVGNSSPLFLSIQYMILLTCIRSIEFARFNSHAWVHALFYWELWMNIFGFWWNYLVIYQNIVAIVYLWLLHQQINIFSFVFIYTYTFLSSHIFHLFSSKCSKCTNKPSHIPTPDTCIFSKMRATSFKLLTQEFLLESSSISLKLNKCATKHYA